MALFRHRQAQAGKIVAISDTHFGDQTQMLDEPELADRFVSVLAGRGEICELILLGDLLDLWMKTEVPALRDARHFIDRLSMLDNVKRVTYVPGNHDHEIFMNAFRMEVDVRIMQGDLTIPKFMPAREYGHSIISGVANHKSRIPFAMTYPFVVRQVNGNEVIFTHGHHLDFYAASYAWARTFWLGRHIMRSRKQRATLHDIEMANIPFCGAMSVWPWVPELVVEGLRFYHLINFFGKLFNTKTIRQSPLRDSLIRENYKEIEGLLPLLGHPEPSCFVFGHTHRPGIGAIPGTPTVVANTGAWTHSEDKTMPTQTWVELDGDVSLYRLAGDDAELMDGASLPATAAQAP